MRALSAILLSIMLSLVGTAVFAAGVYPVDYEKVDFSWKSETIFEGLVKVNLINATDQPIYDVTATISSSPANTKVIDGAVSFGEIPPGD